MEGKVQDYNTMTEKDKRTLKIWLEGLLTIPLYKLDPKDDQWYMTGFTKEQLFGSLKSCLKLMEGKKDEHPRE